MIIDAADFRPRISAAVDFTLPPPNVLCREIAVLPDGVNTNVWRNA